MILPTTTLAYELAGFDENHADNKTADALFAAINPEVQRQAAQKGGFSLPVERIDACGRKCVRLAIGLIRWGSIASMEIAAQMREVRNYKAHSIAEWRPKRDYTPLRQATGADYALIVVVRDLRETSGRKLANAFVGRWTYFKQVGVACVVDLTQNQMTWCHARSDAWGDLRNPQEARRAVAELLSDLTP